MTPPPANAVAALAALFGVQSSFEGGDGRAHPADEDVLLAILGALGTPVGSADEAARALAERTRTLARRPLEPVVVHRIGRGSFATLTVPNRVRPRDIWCTTELEDGSLRRWPLTTGIVAMSPGADEPGASVKRYRFRLEPDAAASIPPGYHRLVVEWPGAHETALLVSAPPCPVPTPGWGAFLPLHALRTGEDWGVGSYSDLADLGRWVGEMGGSMVGALPLYPAFLDPPADPSPYLPVSRLAYNELFIDPTSLPELAAAPEARELLGSDAFRRRLASAHSATLVDYEEVSRLRRQVLTPMADALLAGTSPRRSALCTFVDEHPELLAYAHFRATGDLLGRRSGAEMRADAENDAAAPEPVLGYHLYVQWVAAQQLTAAARATPLYADLPIGVHPDGFDPSWVPHEFVPGVHGGAPPDRFFAGGQDWAFPPLHPERMREGGYGYFIATLRRAFGHAAYLRVDHVMGLQRLYWIPEGFDARHGAYVSYRADELHALVALEAHRAGAVVVGEDLGTVPGEVRRRMAEDRMLRSWVLQFESTPAAPLPAPPAAVLASWGTHDLPRFCAYFWGDDIDERVADGQLSPADATAERAERELWRCALLGSLGPAAVGEADDTAAAALQVCLVHLAASAAALVLVDLEELWGERQPQNRPGTGTEAGNWRRRASRTLEEARLDTASTDFLRSLSRLRHPHADAGRRLDAPR